MEILTGIFILFCAGFIIGQSLLFTRSGEIPKKEPAQKVMVQRDHDQNRADGNLQEVKRDGQEDLSQNRTLKDPHR